MRCNLIKAVCLTLAVSAAGTALAVQKASQGGITLFAEKQSQGSQWDSTTGEAQYMVSYKVTLNNASDKSIEPGKDNKMCFFLFDKNGKSFMSTGIELEMLKKYKPIESRTGSVLFSSADPEILNIPFVRLAFGKECLTK